MEGVIEEGVGTAQWKNRNIKGEDDTYHKRTYTDKFKYRNTQ